MTFDLKKFLFGEQIAQQFPGPPPTQTPPPTPPPPGKSQQPVNPQAQFNQMGQMPQAHTLGYDPKVQQIMHTHDLIPKRIAALEAKRHLHLTKITGFISIWGMMIVAVISVFNVYGGAGVAMFISMGLAYVIYTSEKEMKYLQGKYGV